ncbi:type III secretion system inner membrane ring subunit SctD [Pseudomonadota bacterium AL_CKDN230030165-1A_HGKHYDSX7]
MSANPNEMLELRVLSGLHRDARCDARDGAVLGADPDCDIVLADAGVAPQAGRLRLGERGWTMQAQDAAGAPAEPDTPFNQPLPLGPLWITVARRADPWAVLPAAANDADGSARDTAALDAASLDKVLAGKAVGESVDANTGTPDAPAPAAPAASRPPLPAAPARTRETWPMWVGIGAVVLTIIVAIAMAWWLPAEPKAPPRPDPRLAAEQSMSQISAAIERLGLASRLHVAMSRDGTVRVSGWVRDRGEQERVAAAMTQIWPMPALQVSAEDEALQTAANALRGFSVRYAPRYDGDGRLTVQGIAGSARERASALDAVRAQLPGMTVLGNDIRLAPDVAQAFSKELVDAGLSGVGLAWQGDRLEAAAAGLDDDQMAQLQTVMARFNTTHLGVVALAGPGERQFADSVPFDIRSVVGGPQPFIVLGDGSKLLVGGTYRQYRLAAIEPKRIIFEGPRPAIVVR